MKQLERSVRERLGDQAIVSDSFEAEALQREWRDRWQGRAGLIVAPGSAEQVSDLLKLCSEHSAAVVTQGGNTGLCGGAIPDASETQVLLLTRRLNVLEPVDTVGATLVAGAGCTLQAVQDAAEDAGMMFPLSIASQGTATIGGTVATNAGGIHVLRYGSARDQLLGLEVVLADGSIYNGLTRVRKNNIGYDLRHLFAGSEGTLGVITRVAVQLRPRLSESLTVLASFSSFENVLTFFHELRRFFPCELSAFEVMAARALRFASQYLESAPGPWPTIPDYAVLFELDSGVDSQLQSRFAQAFGAGSGVADELLVAQSEKQRESLWQLRHAISAAQKSEGVSLKHDISVPIHAMPEFDRQLQAKLAAACPGIRPVVFGHIGDGNLHYNLSQPTQLSREAFLALAPELSATVYAAVQEFGGSISAEHGIGQAKRELLAEHMGSVGSDILRHLKQALDPENLMNPGKLISER
ncbi:MAG: FAD-binding oxidoreductase [Pseudomonadota bacterium]